MKELIKKCLLNDEEMKKIIVDNFVKDGMADANEYDWGVNDEECEIAIAQLEKAIPIILSDTKKELEEYAMLLDGKVDLIFMQGDRWNEFWKSKGL